jgi:hypothetical protein
MHPAIIVFLLAAPADMQNAGLANPSTDTNEGTAVESPIVEEAAQGDEGQPPSQAEIEPEDETVMADTNAPVIEDFAVASGNWQTAPRITALISDDNSGLELAIVFYRATEEDTYEQTNLYAGSGGLFMAVLPDGLQQIGFQYYCQVVDAAGNVAFLGGPGRPYVVDPAVQNKKPPPPKVEKVAGEDDEVFTISPFWVFVPTVAGVISTAVSAFWWTDFSGYYLELQATNLSEGARAEKQLWAAGDALGGTIFAVGAIACFAGASGILIYNVVNPVE